MRPRVYAAVVVGVLALLGIAATTVQWYHEQTTATPADGMTLVVESATSNAYRAFKLSALKDYVLPPATQEVARVKAELVSSNYAQLGESNHFTEPFSVGGSGASEFGAIKVAITNAPALATDGDGNVHSTNAVPRATVADSVNISAIQTWAGPTNALTVSTNGGTWLCVASGNTGISNIVGSVASYLCYGTLQISNSTAGNITNFTYANGCVAQGAGSTNALVIPAGKMGLVSAQTWGTYRSNYFTILDQ